MMRTRGLRTRGTGLLPRAWVALLAGLALLLGVSAGPAAATEGSWINEGGDARSPDALSAQWFRGDLYEVVRGNDNQIWWRYRNGAWQVMPGGARTYHRPEVVSLLNIGTGGLQDSRLVVFHVGTDGVVYYSILRGAAGNLWSDWDNVPGNFRTNNGITTASGINNVVLYTVRDQQVYVHNMELWNGAPSFPLGDWGTQHSPRVHGMVASVSTYSRSISTNIMNFEVARGLNDRVYVSRSRTDMNSVRNASFTELPGGGECESVAVGRGGPTSPTTNTNDPDYQAQQNLAIGCISPNDHELWVNRSTDGGQNFTGWSRASTGAAATASPEIHGAPGGEVFAVLSWGGDTPFKQRMIVMKRII
ncbi:hypothetical protein [Streptomyces sp. NPDC048737]|uniref:hypothetical protein n=1 Tax=unclassified Streptomyces TaxID=2593676 RepID=UPI00343DBB47